MRTIGLSIAFIAAMTAGAASAQDRPVNMLNFNHEPQGQEFVPPRFRIVRSNLDEQRIAERARVATAMQSCAASLPYGASYAAVNCSGQAFADVEPVVMAKQLCTARVADTYTDRVRIYRACLEEELEPQGYTVLDPRNAQEMAAYYGVSVSN